MKPSQVTRCLKRNMRNIFIHHPLSCSKHFVGAFASLRASSLVAGAIWSQWTWISFTYGNPWWSMTTKPETIFGGWCFSFGTPPWRRNAPYSYHPVRWFTQNFAIDWLKECIYTWCNWVAYFPMPQTEKHHIMWKDAGQSWQEGYSEKQAQLPSFQWRWWLCWCTSMGWMRKQTLEVLSLDKPWLRHWRLSPASSQWSWCISTRMLIQVSL